MEERKYDRQLRLWGEAGQRALMNASVLLIDADATGSETLKNLVLPGIGRFFIVDDRLVTQQDVSCNFFVDDDNIGRQRAQVVSQYLCELNPDVEGGYFHGELASALVSGVLRLEKFSLVIASNLSENEVMMVADLCTAHSVPLVLVRSAGLVGYCRLQLSGHEVIELKPDSDQSDLRVANPFPELQDYCNSFNFNELDTMEHAHIPFVVILVKALECWKLKNDGRTPSNHLEKEKFKDEIRALSWDFGKELNFQEAAKESYRAFEAKQLPSEVLSLLSSSEEQPKSSFWLLLQTLKLFIEYRGKSADPKCWLPLSGHLPDMTATTEFYTGLQAAYSLRARKDREEFKELLLALAASTNLARDLVDEELIDVFCKNVFNIRFVQTKSLGEAMCGFDQQQLAEYISDPYEDPEQTPLYWFLALRSADRFQSKFGRFPCTDHDAEQLLQDMNMLLCGLQADGMTLKHAQQITRCGNSELHCLSSIIGGVASQEAVKILTHQYMPMDNMFVYNGVAGCGAVYKL